MLKRFAQWLIRTARWFEQEALPKRARIALFNRIYKDTQPWGRQTREMMLDYYHLTEADVAPITKGTNHGTK